MTIRLGDIPGALPPSGDPRAPNWNAIWHWVQDGHAAAERSAVWRAIVCDWAGRIGERLSGTYRLSTSQEFVLLSPPATIDEVEEHRFLAHSRTEIRKALPDIALGEVGGPFVVLITAGMDDYYDFVEVFRPASGGNWGTSGGMYINRGYGHIVTKDAPREGMRYALAHEMVHAHLWHRDMPTWVEEGLAQMFEERLVGRTRFKVDHEMMDRHRRYWSRDRLVELWTARSFKQADEGQELSYNLAEWMVRLMLADSAREALKFIGEAKDEDHGEAAARAAFGVGLDGLVERVLEPIDKLLGIDPPVEHPEDGLAENEEDGPERSE